MVSRRVSTRKASGPRTMRAAAAHGGSGGKAGSERTRMVKLSCHHHVEYGTPFPKVKDELWCGDCRDYATVILVDAVYRAKCRDCRYSHSFGRAHYAANQGARGHSTGKGHTVDLYDGQQIEHTYTPHGGTMQLVAPDGAPPF